jgi:hypothetical protein
MPLGLFTACLPWLTLDLAQLEEGVMAWVEQVGGGRGWCATGSAVR